MLVTLCGIRNLEEVHTRDGNIIDGVKLFIAYPEENVYGVLTDNKYIDRKVFSNFEISLNQLLENINCAIDVEFSPTKKIVGIRLPLKSEKK